MPAALDAKFAITNAVIRRPHATRIIGDAAPQHDGDEHIRRVALFNWDLDGGGVAAQFRDERASHAFAFNGHKRSAADGRLHEQDRLVSGPIGGAVWHECDLCFVAIGPRFLLRPGKEECLRREHFASAVVQGASLDEVLAWLVDDQARHGRRIGEGPLRPKAARSFGGDFQVENIGQRDLRPKRRRSSGTLIAQGLMIDAVEGHVDGHGLGPRLPVAPDGNEAQRQRFARAEDILHGLQPKVEIRVVPDELDRTRNGLLVEVGQFGAQMNAARLRRTKVERNFRRENKIGARPIFAFATGGKGAGSSVQT